MMRLDSKCIAKVVRDSIPHLASSLPKDVSIALRCARDEETFPLPSFALNVLCSNDAISRSEGSPICQDTGSVWVCLEVGPDVTVPGDVFSLVDRAVADAYESNKLRKSLVEDALLNRANTGDNTPAFCELHLSSKPGARLHIMLKGGGSDNASRVVMLPPGSGRDGIIQEVVRCVREKGANACPPLIVGVGIGSTFDKVAGLAKLSLMRHVGSRADNDETASFEAELLAAVNASGVGASGLGGRHTALAVHVQTAPCHIAALPLAINLGCCALRRVTVELGEDMLADKENAVSDTYGQPDFGSLPVRRISLPLSSKLAAELQAGEACLLTGPLYTLRDAGHVRLIEELDSLGFLPYGLEGQTIFYAGPTPSSHGRPFGAVGPTTASRMDFAAARLYEAGVRATLGKGCRSDGVRNACKDTESVYFTTIGGAASYLARCVLSSEIVAYEDLGTEALRKIEVQDLPVVVGIDAKGEALHV